MAPARSKTVSAALSILVALIALSVDLPHLVASSGIAALYPGDVGIEAHPDVIVVEQFEENSLGTVFARFSAAAEQTTQRARFDHYNYWTNMRQSSDGNSWGNLRLNRPEASHCSVPSNESQVHIRRDSVAERACRVDAPVRLGIGSGVTHDRRCSDPGQLGLAGGPQFAARLRRGLGGACRGLRCAVFAVERLRLRVSTGADRG